MLFFLTSCVDMHAQVKSPVTTSMKIHQSFPEELKKLGFKENLPQKNHGTIRVC